MKKILNLDSNDALSAFLMLLLFSCTASAGSAAEAVQPYLENGEAFSLMPLDETHSLVFVGSDIMFLIEDNPAAGNSSLVQGTYQLTSTLNNYASKNNLSISTILPKEADVTNALASINSFNSSRIREPDCHSFIGPDNMPCTDKTSCIRSCYTPLCQGMMRGAGDDFLNAIRDFKSNTSSIDSGTASFEQNYPQITSLAESELVPFITARLNELSAIRNGASAVAGNKLFLEEKSNGFYFCYAVSYNYSGIEKLKLDLELLKAKSYIFSDSWGLASGIDAKTKQRIGLLAKKKWCEEQKASLSEITEATKNSSSRFSSISEVSFSAATLENLRAAFSMQCAQRKFDEANNTLEAFVKNSVEANELLERVSARKAEFESAIENAKSKAVLFSYNSSINQQSLRQLNSSIYQLEKEFPLAANYSEIELLAVSAKQKNVELDRLAAAKIEELKTGEKAGAADFSWVAITAIIVAAVAFITYFFFKKKGGGRSGYSFSQKK